MLGHNKMMLNQATMIEAMQCWLDTKFAEGQVPRVKGVKISNDWFEICTEGAAGE